MLNSPLFRAAVWVLLLLLIALVASYLPFIFVPMLIALRAVFLPVLIAGLLYYWLSPIVNRLAALKLKKGVAILLVFGVILGSIALLGVRTGPLLIAEAESLIESAPGLARALSRQLLLLEQNEFLTRLMGQEMFDLDNLVRRVTDVVNAMLSALAENLAAIVQGTAGVVALLFLVPFILFYMLLDSDKLAPALTNLLLPERMRPEGGKILRDLNRALSNYIQGQALVSLTVGMLGFIGYLVIGLDYAFLLALVLAITNIVPYVGPIVGSIPAVVIGLVHSPGMALRALLVVVIVQQVESLIISPRIMGKKLGSHPVVILLVILVSGSLAGFWGVLFAVPAFAVLRVLVSHLYTFIRLFREADGSTKKD